MAVEVPATKRMFVPIGIQRGLHRINHGIGIYAYPFLHVAFMED